MVRGGGSAEPYPTSVGPNTRARLARSILQAGLRATLGEARLSEWGEQQPPSHACSRAWPRGRLQLAPKAVLG